MRIRNRLSARFVATVTGVGRHADGGNLYLSVSANGGKRWVFLYRWNGKSIEMGLGPARDVSLARAREKASSARAELADGRNPIEVSRQVRAVPTFGEAADALIEAMRPSWKSEKHAAQWKMTLTEYAAPIRAIGVDAITTEDVLGVLRQPLGSEAVSRRSWMPRVRRVIGRMKTALGGVVIWTNFCHRPKSSCEGITQQCPIASFPRS
jgi:Arm DNA-binding domain